MMRRYTAVLALLLPLPGGCERPPAEVREGRALIAEYGCGTCHLIPGVRRADGLVGPPLTSFGRRMLVGGHLPNTPENLSRFIMAPQRVEPGTAMPDLGVTETQAAAMAAYLLTLR